MRGLVFLEEHTQCSSETLQTEDVVSVRGDLDLQLRGRCGETFRLGGEDVFGGLGCSARRQHLMGQSKEHGTHVLIELDTKVKAEFVKLFGRYATRSARLRKGASLSMSKGCLWQQTHCTLARVAGRARPCQR